MLIQINKKCQCGCGKIVKYGNRWIHGHNSFGRKFSEKTKEKIGLAHKGMKHSEESKKKMSIANIGNTYGRSNKGKKRTEETKLKMSKQTSGNKNPFFGKKHTKETKKKMSKAQIGNINAKGHVVNHTKETKLKISEASKGRIISKETKKKIAISKIGKALSEEHKRKISISRIGMKLTKKTREKLSKSVSIAITKKWQDPEYQKKMQKGLNLKPNKPEQYLINLLNKLFPNEYKYVGDFQFFLGGKNPDFMNINGQKKLIELYGDYWHKGQDPQDRINHFKQYGFNTLVIWECELKNRLTLKSKLIEFCSELDDDAA